LTPGGGTTGGGTTVSPGVAVVRVFLGGVRVVGFFPHPNSTNRRALTNTASAAILIVSIRITSLR